MSIPDYQTVMLPLLKYVSDGQIYRMRDAHAAMSAQFALSPEELGERIPSGGLKMYDRVIWAKTYMKEAGLLASPQRGSFQITPRGQEVLAKRSPKD
jgi:restriction system protein